MSFFVSTTKPVKPKTKNVRSIAILYAGILVLFAVTQLYTFEDFKLLVQSFWLPGGAPFAAFFSGFIIVAEVFALPFLLGMKTSTLMRVVSMVLGWVSAVIWLGLSIWVEVTTNAINNIGFLGTLVTLQPGGWTLLFTVALGLLAAWASWGLWPLESKRKK